MEQAQVSDRTEHQELIQIQQHQTHQAHWEKTARHTQEMVVVVEPVVVESMAVYQETVVQVTKVEQAEGLDQI